jgi:hypothetical protein
MYVVSLPRNKNHEVPSVYLPDVLQKKIGRMKKIAKFENGFLRVCYLHDAPPRTDDKSIWVTKYIHFFRP